MIPVEIGDEVIEPNWESFGIRRMDFRPHFDGDLVNVFSAIKPQFTEEMTAQFIKGCAVKLSTWILANRERFGEGDRFQIIIGWPKSVRKSGRQVIKTGGTYEELEQIVTGEKSIELKSSWNLDVFGTNRREKDQE